MSGGPMLVLIVFLAMAQAAPEAAAAAERAFVTPPRIPRNYRGFSISDRDYPADSLRAGEEGTSVTRFQVGANGRVERCDIIKSSGFSGLDLQTCRIIATRSRYEPARDAAGKAVAATLPFTIAWRIKRDCPDAPDVICITRR